MPVARRGKQQRTCVWHRHDCRFGGGDGTFESQTADLLNRIAVSQGKPATHTAASVQEGNERTNPPSYGLCRVPREEDRRAAVGIFQTRMQREAVDAAIAELTELITFAKQVRGQE